jgi:acetyltransferase-like isoleucine patch superfamily enzyme
MFKQTPNTVVRNFRIGALAFDADFFAHVNQSRIAEGDSPSRVLSAVELALQVPLIKISLWLVESFLSFLLSINLPIYRSLVSAYVNNMRGLPSFSGNYARALYWRSRLQHIGRNVLIDQNVFFANPGKIRLNDFCFIDKNVMILAKAATIGTRVHLAPNVFVSGGGSFSIADHACVAAGSQIITSTEVIKEGNRCSGPMTKPQERRVLRSEVVIEEDAFIGAGAILLPGIVVKRGAVVGAGAVVQRNCEPWSIYVSAKTIKVGERDPVRES